MKGEGEWSTLKRRECEEARGRVGEAYERGSEGARRGAGERRTARGEGGRDRAGGEGEGRGKCEACGAMATKHNA